MNGYLLHMPFADDESGVKGAVCVEQTRAVDLSARPCRKLGEIAPDDMNEVLNLLAPVFGL